MGSNACSTPRGYGPVVAQFGWNNEAWEQIPDYKGAWAGFSSRFHFRPGMDPSTWPAIVERAGSVTIDLSSVFTRDWQHPAYWFKPHKHRGTDEVWRVPPFPNGDCSVIVTEDLNQGTFGHPWEETLSVFGPDLVRSLVPRLSEWLPIKRTTP